MTRQILLVRHPPVTNALRGICYGVSDVPLADDGPTRIEEIVAQLLAQGPYTHLYHSGLSRCAAVANALAARTGMKPVIDPRLRERCFGTWELRPWDDIHAESGDAMMGMVTAPETWRPPSGETTFELRDRVWAWYAEQPAHGRIVAITHGGPIASLVGTLNHRPVTEWPTYVPPFGSITSIS